MKSTVIFYPIGDSINQPDANSELQSAIDSVEEAGDKIIDVKVNHFCIDSEVWVQYTILSEEEEM